MKPRAHLDDVRFLLESGESPEQIAARLGVTTDAIGRSFARHGDLVRARPFWAAYQRARKAASA